MRRLMGRAGGWPFVSGWALTGHWAEKESDHARPVRPPVGLGERGGLD